MLLSDKRTIAGITLGGTSTFLHGLAKTPDKVQIRFIQTLATSTNMPLLVASVDATAVTIQNCGATTSPNMEVVTQVLHSIMV